MAYPLIELTASSLNFPWREDMHGPPGPGNPGRVGPVLWEANFGAVEIEWHKGEVALALHEDIGRRESTQRVRLAELRPQVSSQARQLTPAPSLVISPHGQHSSPA